MGCMLCPRQCGAARENGALGFCGMDADVRVARAALHPFEEPPVCGERGSGTVFFTGCSLRCIFCQNSAIRAPEAGFLLSVKELAALFLYLQEKGAENINLVTATHYADSVAKALRLAKPQLHVPVVYNCGGYERVETLKLLEGLVDVYLPDFKYMSTALSAAYSAAPDYAEVATAALREMYRQVGAVRFDVRGMLTRGVMVRHLVLPGSRADSIAVLEHLAALLPVADIRLSLMRQYTPDFTPPDAPKNLKRRLTSFEYDSVAARALELGFEGYFQEKESASAAFTPDFAEADLLREFLHKKVPAAQE
ncbi:MAG: radical SAM protein [Ruminococcaceae bacterium]|nr:radical SAM protein [Oscillospiraceae bacterium]